MWGDQDGGAGTRGEVLSDPDADGWLRVQWPGPTSGSGSGTLNGYRFGADGKYDVEVFTARWGFKLRATPGDLAAADESLHPAGSASSSSTSTSTSFSSSSPSSAGASSTTAAGGGPIVHPGTVKIIESPHPYRDDSNEHQAIEIPGATSYSITFDPQSTTEKGYDYVRFYKNSSHSEFWGEEKYSGGESMFLFCDQLF